MRVDIRSPSLAPKMSAALIGIGFNRYRMALIRLVTYGDYGNIVIVTAHRVIKDISGSPVKFSKALNEMGD